MAIGVRALRSAWLRDRRTKASRPTIREVCLIGMDHPARDPSWTEGQEVTWQGRSYRVMAGSADSPQPARNYIHLATRDGD